MRISAGGEEISSAGPCTLGYANVRCSTEAAGKTAVLTDSSADSGRTLVSAKVRVIGRQERVMVLVVALNIRGQISAASMWASQFEPRLALL